MILNNVLHSTGSFTLEHGGGKVKQKDLSQLKRNIKKFTNNLHSYFYRNKTDESRKGVITSYRKELQALNNKLVEYKNRVPESNSKKRNKISKMRNELYSKSDFLRLEGATKSAKSVRFSLPVKFAQA